MDVTYFEKDKKHLLLKRLKKFMGIFLMSLKHQKEKKMLQCASAYISN